MRTVAVVLALAGMTLSAFAEKPVTVAELERAVEAAHGHPDDEVAEHLSALVLSERLSPLALGRLKAELPGEKSSRELAILAGQSAFLSLPAGELLSLPAPGQATQRTIMALVVNYVAKTVHQMPNFLASRETHSFQDRPKGLLSSRPLHLVGQTTATVIYRDGQELNASAAKGKAGVSRAKGQVAGLVSSGEFGPILSIVLTDAARSKLAWSHWESGPGGPLAVFGYAVPRKQSHYQVRLGMDPQFQGDFYEYSGYHGEMAIDPVSGAILRVTAVADLSPEEPVVVASIMVEYEPVEIGGKSYICPIRSVALAQRPLPYAEMGAVPSRSVKQARLITLLNEVEFKQYHMFRGDSRVLSEEEANQQTAPGSGEDGQVDYANMAESANSSAPASGAESSVAKLPAPPAEIPVAPSLAQPGIPERATPESAAVQHPVFKTTTREVVVDVVVSKNDGDPIAGLGKKDFAVLENGTLQAIDFFEEHSAGARVPSAPPEMPPMPAGMRTNVPPAPESEAVNVLLLDTLNTEPQDQAYVRNQVMKFLTHMQPGTRVAIFMLGSKLRFVQGFTTDTSALLAALKDKRNGTEKNRTFQSRSDAASDAAEVDMLQTMQASPYAIQALQAAQADTAAYNYAARASMTFEALTYLGEYLAGVPGRKNLLWFAESFPVIIFPTAEQRDQMSRNRATPGYLDKERQTENLFTISKIAVYPIAAQGVMTGHIMEADAAGPASGGGLSHAGSSADTTMAPYIAGAAGRADAIYAMEQLAASTGGKAFYNTNDLNGAMQRAINDGAHYYTIGYSPSDKKMDGSYRPIEVRLADGKYKLAYRHGYNAIDAAPAQAKNQRDPLWDLLVYGLPGASGVLYGVRVERATEQTADMGRRAGENAALQGPLTRYAVDFVIRADEVSWQSAASGGRSGKILVGVKAFDEEGNAINWEASMQAMEANAEEAEALQKNGVPVHLEIDLPTGKDFRLVTAVYDRISEKAGTLEVPIGFKAASAH